MNGRDEWTKHSMDVLRSTEKQSLGRKEHKKSSPSSKFVNPSILSLTATQSSFLHGDRLVVVPVPAQVRAESARAGVVP